MTPCTAPCPILQKGAAAAGAGDGVSVLEGGADAPTGMAATEDEYDQEDSFLADSGELVTHVAG